jgi:hypothetical protein
VQEKKQAVRLSYLTISIPCEELSFPTDSGFQSDCTARKIKDIPQEPL